MKNSQQHIIISGLSGSGKSYVSNIFANQGWRVISAGDSLREICSNLGLNTDRDTLRKFGKNLLREKGNHYFANMLIDKMDGEACSLFEGIRPLGVIRIIQRKYNCLTIYIESQEQTRLNRLRERDNIQLLEFNKLEHSSHEKQIKEVKKLADIIIENNSSLMHLERKILSITVKCQKHLTRS